MKVLFTAVRHGDVADVARRLDRDPSLISAVATAPKKDHGQSLLQVAIKSGNVDVARLLLDRGADVNYIDVSDVNDWNMPVVHDAIRAAVMCSRFRRNRALPGQPPRYEQLSTLERFESAFGVLERLLAAGADVNAVDSKGNRGYGRFVLDARQVVDEPLFDDLRDDLRRVLGALRSAGLDEDYIDERFGCTLTERLGDGPVAAILVR